MSAVRWSTMSWQRQFWLALCLSLVALAARAFAPPAFQGDVLDQAGLLSAEERATLSQRIAELRSQDGIWAAVFITASLQGDSIETAALKTFEQWRLGRADKDNGLLAGFDVMRRSMQGDPAALAELTAGSADGQVAEIDGALFLQRLLAVCLGNLCFPLIYWLRRRRRADAQKIRGAFILFAFFGLFFGLFFGVFSQAFPGDPEIVWALLGANALFALVFSLPLLFGGRGRAGASASDAGHWHASSSSSSWDSGSSDSSSSGGGSSGGGGASGDY